LRPSVLEELEVLELEIVLERPAGRDVDGGFCPATAAIIARTAQGKSQGTDLRTLILASSTSRYPV